MVVTFNNNNKFMKTKILREFNKQVQNYEMFL